MLLITSFVGSVIGFLVCYGILKHVHLLHPAVKMRICMVNGMSLAFIFAMLVELSTGSKTVAVVLPLVCICIPILWLMKPFNILDMAEVAVASLMSVSMSVMLIGMVGSDVIWVIQCCLLVVEMALYMAIRRHFRDAT